MEALHLRRLERLRNASLSTNGINATAPGGEPGAADSGLLDNATAAPERKVHVLDAMSATGLRAIRYALEVPEVGSITANDKDPDAVEAIRSNVALSQVPDGKVHAVESDAVSLMLARAGAGELFDFIDLDPFGSPAALLSAALHALRPGGMLAVTATDMRVLCGNQPEVCFSRYGSMSLRGPYAKEMAIRILLHAIRTAAAPLGRTVEPVVSVYMDFYVRVFVRVWPNRAGALRTCLHSGNVVHCQSCHTFSLQPNAVLTHNRRISVAYASALSPRGDGSEAGHDREAGGAGAGAGGACCGVGPFLFGGPVWLGKLQSPDVVLSLRNALRESPGSIASGGRLTGLLTLLQLELPTPFFMSHSAMTKVLHCNPPKLGGLRAQIAAAGYNVSQTHTDAEGIKTDAPIALVWDIFRLWLRDNPVSSKRANDVGARLTSRDLVVLNESKYNETSPYYERINLNLPDPVQKQILRLHHPEYSDDNDVPGNESSSSSHKRALSHVSSSAEGTLGVLRKMPRSAGVALFPKNPEPLWGPKKSTGFRGRAGHNASKRQSSAASSVGMNDLLPSALGIPEDLLQARAMEEATAGAGIGVGDEVQEEKGQEQSAAWLRRMFQRQGGSGMFGGITRPEERPEEETLNEATGL
eukprot:Tamp_05105.p1 GENE.Tamp_05105~~Tamp_05105.p1  ORF type:complete len:723 (-),score=126.78 Tamp_05105:899-2824(-)